LNVHKNVLISGDNSYTNYIYHSCPYGNQKDGGQMATMDSKEWAAFYGAIHKATFQTMSREAGLKKGASRTQIAKVLGCRTQFTGGNLEYWTTSR